MVIKSSPVKGHPAGAGTKWVAAVISVSNIEPQVSDRCTAEQVAWSRAPALSVSPSRSLEVKCPGRKARQVSAMPNRPVRVGLCGSGPRLRGSSTIQGPAVQPRESRSTSLDLHCHIARSGKKACPTSGARGPHSSPGQVFEEVPASGKGWGWGPLQGGPPRQGKPSANLARLDPVDFLSP